jgi:hypothetical protein
MDIGQQGSKSIEEIFLPYATKQRKVLNHNGNRLAHYTSAENAIRIIQSKNIWLRNTRNMNDYSEVQHGYFQLQQYFQNETNKSRFIDALDKCSPNIGKDAISLFDQWWVHIQNSSYISCLSMHEQNEDEHGRLSMWRAFGRGVAGVAIVFKVPDKTDPKSNLNIFLTPAAYFNHEELCQELDEVINNIESNLEFLKLQPRANLVGWVYMAFMMAVVSLKHNGFREEQEWRLIHSPIQFPSQHVNSSTEIISGIPQIVYKLELINKPEAGITEVELQEILDKVIIGPSQFAQSIKESLVKELERAGVENSESKVVISGIPLRN